jgi:hypothetical protein
VLDVVRDEDLIGRAAREGARLRAGLEELQARNRAIGDDEVDLLLRTLDASLVDLNA